MIDRFTVQRILDAAQIVDVVQDFVSLKRAGANFKGLCPFHDDKTPSFMVSPAKNYCKCFACGKGGSPVGFIMEHEQLTYPEALKYLARKYHIEVEEREQTPEEKALVSERESMFILNDFALKWFEQQLYESNNGRALGMAYFRHRGFRDDIIRKFRLGFSPTTRDAFSTAAISKGYSKEILLKTGLVYESQHDGRLIDRFHSRVIFPIFNISGKVCGFGGRVLDAATKGVNVKYQNSPESAVYSKKRELYGLFQAKAAIAKADSCYLVEGYTDVMAMHQMGVENVVASSGTALTNQQIALIHRLTSNIVVVYDGDAAGIKASQRGIDMLLEAGMNVRLLLLPDGDDPDSFARKHNQQEYKEYLASHQVDFISFKTNLLLHEAQNDPIKLSNLVTNIVESISRIPYPITRSTYIRQASQMLQLDEQLITTAVSKQLKVYAEQAQKERERDQAIQAGSTTSQATESSTIASDVSTDTYTADEKSLIGLEASIAESQPSEREVATHPYNEEPGKEVSNNSTLPVQHRQGQIVIPKKSIEPQEREIVRMIVRYGDKDMCLVEDENGNERPITVVEFIDNTLRQDQLQFETPIYKEILQIALDNVRQDRRDSCSLFLNHPNPEISRLAFTLSTDEEELSRYHSKSQHIRTDDERLYEILPLLIANYKLGIVELQLSQLQRSLLSPEIRANREAENDIMTRYVNLKKVQSTLAKQCGERVMGG